MSVPFDYIEYLKSKFPDEPYSIYHFVEAGAHDGVGDSQTKVLEDVGWRGLCVEPSSAFDGLKTSRKCKVSDAILGGIDGQEETFVEIHGEGIEMSGVEKYFDDAIGRGGMSHSRRKIKTISLASLLCVHEMPVVIEFLSLDTEGSELEILLHHDFLRYTFRVMEIEYHDSDRRRTDLMLLLKPIGYRLLHDDGYNLFFAHRSVR